MKITLKAITAEGFGGKDFYTETCIVSSEEELTRARINFALKYGVQLDSVVVEKEV